MKKIAVVTALLGVLAFMLPARPASAHHGDHFWGGFAAGTATGLVVGTLAAPHYYAPAPVYVVPAQPVCRDYYTDGYWRQVPMVADSGGFTTYRNEWVPATHQRVCQ